MNDDIVIIGDIVFLKRAFTLSYLLSWPLHHGLFLKPSEICSFQQTNCPSLQTRRNVDKTVDNSVHVVFVNFMSMNSHLDCKIKKKRTWRWRECGLEMGLESPKVSKPRLLYIIQCICYLFTPTHETSPLFFSYIRIIYDCVSNIFSFVRSYKI